MISRLRRFDSPLETGVDVPLVFPFEVGVKLPLVDPFGGVLLVESLNPLSLLGTESMDPLFDELLLLISLSLLKGRLRNDILATPGWGIAGEWRGREHEENK
jgi:hypothetical protein